MDKLLLLSLQFLPETGRGALPMAEPVLLGLASVPLPGPDSLPGRPAHPVAGTNRRRVAGNSGGEGRNRKLRLG